jgi:hypothetical protein
VVVEPCPPRRGNRKGAVESSVRYVCGRWWRTMTAVTPTDAQRSLDAFCCGPGDAATVRPLAVRRPSPDLLRGHAVPAEMVGERRLIQRAVQLWAQLG